MKGTWDADRDPLVALRGGNPALFDEFVRVEMGTIVGFFQRLGADHAEAQDLAQEVFLKLFRSAPTYTAQSRFSSYALRVARNAWIDRRRRRGVRPEAASLDQPIDDEHSLLQHLAGSSASVTGALESAEERRRLAQAVRRLGEVHATVFELAVVQGLPYADIARDLGIPVGTVKSRVFHALRKLRELLDEGGAA